MSKLPCPIRSSARTDPDRIAVESSEGSISYRELDSRTDSAAARLRNILGEGDTAGVWMSNSADSIVLIMALLRSGATAALLSDRLPPAAVVEQMDRVRPEVLLTNRHVPTPDRRVLHPEELISVREEGARLDGGAPEAAQVFMATDRAASIVFTSGSRGRAKPALLTFGNHYFSALGSNENLRLRPGDRWLLTLPLYHVGGLAILFRCFLARATVVIAPRGVELQSALLQTSATHISIVATQLLRLLKAGRPAPSHLNAVLLGGGPVPLDAVEQALALGFPLYTTYGLTEMASQVTTTPPGAGIERLRTSGRLLPHRELKLAADGEIHVRGRTLFAGYIEHGHLVRPFDSDGWFATGDTGRLDEAGFLTVLGRKDNMFISGGENVMPEEIELALTALPEVLDAVVVPLEDEEFGFRPVAFIRTSSGEVSQDSVREHLLRVLPRFKVPIRFFDLPESPGLKTNRVHLQERARALTAAR